MKASASPSRSPTVNTHLPDSLRHFSTTSLIASTSAAVSAAAASTTSTPTATIAAKPPPQKSRKLAISCSPSPPPKALPRSLSVDGELTSAIHHLRSSDPLLSPLIDSHPLPSFPSPPLPPFHALARSILYQQLATKAASSVYSRFLSLCGGSHLVLPHVVLSIPPSSLRQIGVSDRKASYLLDLARKYHTGILSDESVSSMDDRSLFTMLTMVKGIGSWSVHMFMIFSLHRPDVLPVGDLGVRKGVQMLYGLDALPRPSQMESLCERWRPYRSVGAWYMWRLAEAKSGGSGLATSMQSDALVAVPPPPPLPPPTPPVLPASALQVDHQQHVEEVEEQVLFQQQHMISPILQGYPNFSDHLINNHWGANNFYSK